MTPFKIEKQNWFLFWEKPILQPYLIYCIPTIMVIPVVEFSREGYKIRKIFGKKSTVVAWNYWILRIGVVSSCQKSGIILENKVILNWCYQKLPITKKCAPNFVFFNEKKIGKIWMIFDVENWLWKSDFSLFWPRLRNRK